MKLKLMWPLALLALVVITPTLKSLLPRLREPWKLRSADLQQLPDREHGNAEASKAGLDRRKAIDPEGISDLKLVGPLAGLMDEAQQGQDSGVAQPY